MRLGVICPSEIAIRRFMPALSKFKKDIEFAGVGVFKKEERFGSDVESLTFEKAHQAEIAKAKVFVDNYGGKIFDGYETIATSSDIDALYVPLPPALHYKWAKIALEHGKNVLVEKPSTISAEDSGNLVQIARRNNLALHENYMFIFHNQLDAIEDIIRQGKLGDVRLYSIKFGFPKRAANDFRYNKALGGGALIDAGGYTIRYAMRLLGPSAKIKYAQSNYTKDSEVDIYGSAALVNVDGVTAQVSFGMDNNYKCELEVWGSKGCLTTGRVLTAPAGFVPEATISNGNEDRTIELPSDDSFYKSIQFFLECVNNKQVREQEYSNIIKQAELVDEFKRLAGWNER